MAFLLTPEWDLHFVNLLGFHLTAVQVLSIALPDGFDLIMFNGEPLTVSINSVTNSISFINAENEGASVVQADIIASNGLVHTMDAVLKPSFFYRSVIDLSDTYTAFLSLIATAGLEDTLRSDAWTFFAPTNDVINALPAETDTFLTNTESASALVEVLTFHMITAVLTISDMLARLDSVVTIQGSEVTISLIGRVNVNGIPVVEPDSLAVNGVTHGIARLLILHFWYR